MKLLLQKVAQRESIILEKNKQIIMKEKGKILKGLCLLTNKLFKKPLVSGRESMENYAENEFQKARQVLELYKPYHSIEGKYILDIGCGMGGASVYYALNGAKKLIGIDTDEKRINTARSFASFRDVNNISFGVQNASNLSYESNTFDVIISNDTFEHLYKPDIVMKECYRVLKEGGTLNFTFRPYRGCRGAHLYDYIYIPWCQVFFPEEVLVKIWKEGFKKDWETKKSRSASFSPEEIEHISTVRDLMHVNMIKISQLKKVITETDFKIVLYKTYASKYFYPLKICPFINEYFIKMVVVVLEK